MPLCGSCQAVPRNPCATYPLCLLLPWPPAPAAGRGGEHTAGLALSKRGESPAEILSLFQNTPKQNSYCCLTAALVMAAFMFWVDCRRRALQAGCICWQEFSSEPDLDVFISR